MGGSVISGIVALACLIALAVTMGPVIDYFAYQLTLLPADAAPLANPVKEMFTWVYAFILLSAVVAFAYIWRGVIRSVWYEMRDEF